MTKYLGLGLLALLIAALLYVRHAPEDAKRWHVDPERVTGGNGPNSYLLAGDDAVYVPLPPRDALLAFDRVAQAEPRTGMFAGGFEEGQATYVQRSAFFRFPDYVTVRAQPAEGGSTLSIYSRSRFGYSDLGANKARVQRWLDELESTVKK